MRCSNHLVAGLLLALAAHGAASGQVLIVDHVADSLQAALVARAIDLPPRLTALDSLNGFGPYRFGTPVAELPEPLTRLEVLKHNWVHFYAPAAVANVEGLVLPGWQLAAYGGRLAGIGFAPTSPQYGEALLALLQARFGPGCCTGYQRYEWRGQVVRPGSHARLRAAGGRRVVGRGVAQRQQLPRLAAYSGHGVPA